MKILVIIADSHPHLIRIGYLRLASALARSDARSRTSSSFSLVASSRMEILALRSASHCRAHPRLSSIFSCFGCDVLASLQPYLTMEITKQ